MLVQICTEYLIQENDRVTVTKYCQFDEKNFPGYPPKPQSSKEFEDYPLSIEIYDQDENQRRESNQNCKTNDDDENHRPSENNADLINVIPSALGHIPIAGTSHIDAHASSAQPQ